MWGNSEFPKTAGGNVKWYSYWEKDWELIKKLNIRVVT